MTDNEIIDALRACHDHGNVIVQYCYEAGKTRDITLADVLGVFERQKEMTEFWKAQYSFSWDNHSATTLKAKENYEMIRMEQMRVLRDDVELLKKERDKARRDCAVAERNHRTAITDFKVALLKKIFPYDTVDKKQYSINAYAVEKAIIETAELLGGVHESN